MRSRDFGLRFMIQLCNLSPLDIRVSCLPCLNLDEYTRV